MKEREIYCLELDKTFSGALEAAAELNINRTGILKCCAGILGTYHNYHFYYKDNPIEKEMKKPHKRAVYCVELDKSYESAAAASKDLNCPNSSGISKCCKGQLKTYHGYHFKFI